MLLSNEYFLNLIGYEADEIMGESVFDFTHKDDIEATKEYIQKVQNSKDTNGIYIEKRYLHKRGFTVWVAVSIYVSKDENDAPRYYIIFVNDIRDRKKIEAEKEKASKILKEAAKVFNNATEAISILNKSRKIHKYKIVLFEFITNYDKNEISFKQLYRFYYL